MPADDSPMIEGAIGDVSLIASCFTGGDVDAVAGRKWGAKLETDVDRP